MKLSILVYLLFTGMCIYTHICVEVEIWASVLL